MWNRIYINAHYTFLQIYTDGSKSKETGRPGAAFYVPEFEAKKAVRITDGTSRLYTEEMITIPMAQGWVYEIRPDKVIMFWFNGGSCEFTITGEYKWF